MDYISWPDPTFPREPAHALAFEGAGPHRLLIVPALFDEGNRLRRLTVEVQRRLAGRHTITSVLPDLPGCNESLAPLEAQDLASWRGAMEACTAHFGATHVLTFRGGALAAPRALPALHYAPVTGAAILRQMLRARLLSTREAGRTETRARLENLARTKGLDLNGYRIGARLFTDLEQAEPRGEAQDLPQSQIGGAALWLRAEPGESPEQADTLARAVAEWVEGSARP
ncbi:hypothetical protein [Novosphingobium mangrovi (ex Hu et al. 2023)]|uniref:Uncharacterized protein n=1 Tax=Novosphingobium mangrovi (ex Hu et al. 2023) TaxID=2930094 RepID=A0ABT0A920_9SPHN|nr:hypothetical protein [Novosphingobium mangrovi (ex Hu et al. 2023)]MCJ1959701.1 hypothetical protein [Novosphingobium mangrovi (ex Hu et al. 2023)]